jgi:hypothetical protein
MTKVETSADELEKCETAVVEAIIVKMEMRLRSRIRRRTR